MEWTLGGGAGKASSVISKEDLPHTLCRGIAFVVSDKACLRRGLGGVGGEGTCLRCLGVGESRNGNRGGEGVSGLGLNMSASFFDLYLGGVNDDASINGCGLDPVD